MSEDNETVVVQVRIRRANVPALLNGIVLGTDVSGKPIGVKFEVEPDNPQIHRLVVLSPNPMGVVPKPEFRDPKQKLN